MIRFSCPACTLIVEVPDAKAGLKTNCPGCGRRVEVPEPSKTAPGKPAPPAGGPESARPRLSASADPDAGLVAVEDCPECGKSLQVPQADIGRRVACPRCAHVFVARQLKVSVPDLDEERAERRRRDEEDEYDRPRRRDEDDDDRPRRRARRPARFCDECGAEFDEDGTCPECDEGPPRRLSARQRRQAHSKKTAAGICGILLGGFGVHKFVLGFTTPGVIMLLVSLLTLCIAFKIMWIIGIIEGITYLTKSDEEFYQTYMVEKKEWF